MKGALRSFGVRWACLLLSLAAGSLSSCGETDPLGSSPAASMDAVAPAGPHRVVVFATASLREPITALARRYERDHPGARVDLRVEGGAQLLARMLAGEPADVIAIADSSLMSRFAGAALLAAHSAEELARNRIAIAVAKGNPKSVQSLHDLARTDLRVGLGARSSSIGRYARWVLSRQQLDVTPAVEAASAEAVLATVVAGDVDAAIVYRTSFRGAEGATCVEVPEADNTPVLYSIAAVREAPEPRGAAAFRALALGPVGQAALSAAGFLPIGAKAR